MMKLRCPALKQAAVLLSVVLGSAPCSGAGVDSWTDVPGTVKKFQRALTTSFNDRTSLLLGTTAGVIGGTGSANAPFVYIPCTAPVADCFPPTSQGDYVAVIEEQDLPAVLKLLSPATGDEGSPVPNIPQSVITLPASTGQPFNPAPIRPLSMYYSSNSSTAEPWNPSGLDLMDLALPCGVFLAPEDLAPKYREQAQQNNRRVPVCGLFKRAYVRMPAPGKTATSLCSIAIPGMTSDGVRTAPASHLALSIRYVLQGFEGPTYGAAIALSTLMTLRSDSASCIASKRCLPLGGYSVWAAMPPLPQSGSTPAPPRQQIVVMSHWDSRSLFRYMATGTHSALSGLVAMLVAVDILSANRGEGYDRDLVFLSLSGEAYDLIGSRQLLYNLDTGSGPHNASVAGLRKGSIAGLVEVGMLGRDPNAFNDTLDVEPEIPPRPSPDNRAVFLHQAGSDALGMTAAFTSAADFANAPQVFNSTRPDLPPSSLLAWRAMLPDVGAVHINDFDDRMDEDSFWSYKDLGLRRWSRRSVALSAILLARTLHGLASGSPLDVSEVSVKKVSEITDELFECLAKPHGLRCHLVQSMTGTHTFSSADRNTAEQYVGVLRELPTDDQSRGPSYKKNIERFVWEFLANRTYTGEPHDVPDGDGAMVGCDNNVNTCPEQEVCLHVSGERGDQGQCVRADVMYTPAYPTTLKFEQCDREKDAECKGVWVLAEPDGSDRDASAWAQMHGLPEDPVWTETFNEIVGVTVNLRERPLHDAILLVCGVLSTALVTGVVIGIKALHKRQKLD